MFRRCEILTFTKSAAWHIFQKIFRKCHRIASFRNFDMSQIENQMHLVLTTFRSIMPMAATTADLFFDYLFIQAPSLRSKFSKNPVHRWLLFTALFNSIGHELLDPPALRHVLQGIGERLARCGVTDDDYIAAGDALLRTLDQQLGVRFTQKAREAWCAAYGFAIATVRDAAWEHHSLMTCPQALYQSKFEKSAVCDIDSTADHQ
jgi:hemoglobin-like flavoprotein